MNRYEVTSRTYWGVCANCGKPIYVGDDIWKVSDMVFCDRCVRKGEASEDEIY